MHDVFIIYHFLLRQTLSSSQPITGAVAKACIDLQISDFTARQGRLFIQHVVQYCQYPT